MDLFSNTCYSFEQGSGFSHPFRTRLEHIHSRHKQPAPRCPCLSLPGSLGCPGAMDRSRRTRKWKVVPGLLCCLGHVRGRGWEEKAMSQRARATVKKAPRTGLRSNPILPEILFISFLNAVPLVLMATFHPCYSVFFFFFFEFRQISFLLGMEWKLWGENVWSP